LTVSSAQIFYFFNGQQVSTQGLSSEQGFSGNKLHCNKLQILQNIERRDCTGM
jgi:hypothetical protein